MPTSILIDTENKTYQTGEWEGDHLTPCTVTQIAGGTYRITCDCYYSNSGRFEMTISQDFERAVKIFIAALDADTKLESGLPI